MVDGTHLLQREGRRREYPSTVKCVKRTFGCYQLLSFLAWWKVGVWIVSNPCSLLASASNDETIRIWRKTEQPVEEDEEEEEKEEKEEEESGKKEGVEGDHEEEMEEDEEEEGEDREDILHYECISILKGHRSGIY